MWKAGVLKNNGDRESANFTTQEDAEMWVLEQSEKGIKKSIVVNKENIQERIITNWEE